ncbi:hypothetical protein N7475_003453 [Penicillium sp. IBT 31633x]|nr:hypothetical protein N7475_003453 [Penicillium sp. IBT 31633x]
MSARLSGRQSPPPECQSGAQQQDTPGTGRTDVGKHPDPNHSRRSSEDFKEHGLKSNPEPLYEKAEAAKYAKGQH